MFREVSLEVRSRNDLMAAAKLNGATLSIVDCWPLNKKEMALLLELSGIPSAVRGTIVTLGSMSGVREAQEVADDPAKTRLLVVLEKPRICQAAEDGVILCLDCPFNSTEIPARWRFIARRTSDLEQIVSKLGDEGIQVRIQDISPLEKNVTLTQKEKGIIAVAVEMGYFDFPRRVTLEGLSQMVGVEPTSLSRIFHMVE